jgi:hypothetical protein
VATLPEENPKIPNPVLCDFASQDTTAPEARLPTVAECAAHLELLEAFYHLRQQVLASTALETVLGIKPEPRTVFRNKYQGYRRGYRQEAVKLRDESFEARRAGKWPFFLSLAAARFLCWIEIIGGEFDRATSTDRAELPHLPPLGKILGQNSKYLRLTDARYLDGMACLAAQPGLVSFF